MSTYAEDPNRFDSTYLSADVGISNNAAATPTQKFGTLCYSPQFGLRFNAGTDAAPNWRPITIG